MEAPATMACNRVHRFYFVHVPKTGGLAMCASLQDRFPDTIFLSTHRSLSAAYERGDVRAGDYVFVVVRNPYERLISAWNYLQAGGMNDDDRRDAARWVTCHPTFASFCQSLCLPATDANNPLHRQIHLLPQASFVSPEATRAFHVRVHHTVDEAMRALCCDHIGIDPASHDSRLAPVPRRNESGEAGHRARRFDDGQPLRPALLDEQTAAWIATAYRDDFERFQFDPASWRSVGAAAKKTTATTSIVTPPIVPS